MESDHASPARFGDHACALFGGNVRLASVVMPGALDDSARMPLFAGTAALGRMMAALGHGDEDWARIEGPGGSDGLNDIDRYNAGADGALDDAFAIDDLYLLADRKLAVRLRLGGDRQLTLRVYQPDAVQLRLFMTDQALLRRTTIAITPLALRHPYLPVLLVAVDAEEHLVATRLIAFPSLLRGGMHYGEAVMTHDGALGGVDATALDLLETLIGASPDMGCWMVGTVTVALTGAVGTEAMFLPTIASWLRFLGVTLEGQDGDPRFQWQTVGKPRQATHRLEIAADAVPAIAILCARGPIAEPADVTTASTITVDRYGRNLGVLLALPRGMTTAALSPIVPSAQAPRLIRNEIALPTNFAMTDTVAAIALHDFTGFGGIPDMFGKDPPVQLPVTLCIVVVGGDTARVAAAVRPSDFSADVFGVEPLPPTTLAARIDTVIARSSADIVVVVTDTVNPVDPTMMKQLIATALLDGVADVSCSTLVGPIIEAVAAQKGSSTALFATSGSADDEGAMVDPRSCDLPPGIWPVLSNRSGLIVIRRKVLADLGLFAGAGLSASLDTALLELAVRARRAGLISLCDTRLAVLSSAGNDYLTGGDDTIRSIPLAHDIAVDDTVAVLHRI